LPSSSPDEATMRRHLSAVGRKAALDQLAILDARGAQESDQVLLAGVKLARRMLDSGAPLETGELAIHGGKVMASTGAKGPAVGTILRALLERVLDDPSCNTAETLEQLAIEMARAE
jgi:tRNA nucleotidyltransferase (CCA-adding enzyme)